MDVRYFHLLVKHLGLRGQNVHLSLNVSMPRLRVCMTKIAGDFRHANNICSSRNGPLAGRFCWNY